MIETYALREGQAALTKTHFHKVMTNFGWLAGNAEFAIKDISFDPFRVHIGGWGK